MASIPWKLLFKFYAEQKRCLCNTLSDPIDILWPRDNITYIRKNELNLQQKAQLPLYTVNHINMQWFVCLFLRAYCKDFKGEIIEKARAVAANVNR